MSKKLLALRTLDDIKEYIRDHKKGAVITGMTLALVVGVLAGSLSSYSVANSKARIVTGVNGSYGLQKVVDTIPSDQTQLVAIKQWALASALDKIVGDKVTSAQVQKQYDDAQNLYLKQNSGKKASDFANLVKSQSGSVADYKNLLKYSLQLDEYIKENYNPSKQTIENAKTSYMTSVKINGLLVAANSTSASASQVKDYANQVKDALNNGESLTDAAAVIKDTDNYASKAMSDMSTSSPAISQVGFNQDQMKTMMKSNNTNQYEIYQVGSGYYVLKVSDAKGLESGLSDKQIKEKLLASEQENNRAKYVSMLLEDKHNGLSWKDSKIQDAITSGSNGSTTTSSAGTETAASN